MDSRLIYIKSTHLIAKVKWEPSPNYGWWYCGISEDFDTKLVKEVAEKQFPGERVLFVPNRQESRVIRQADIIPMVVARIDDLDLVIWSEDFCRIMEFRTNGVFRFGSACG